MISIATTVNRTRRAAATAVRQVSLCDFSRAGHVFLCQVKLQSPFHVRLFASPDSKEWHQVGRGSRLLCASCRTYENKHGCLPPASKSGASFMFKPVKEEEEVNSKHGMRTRRSRAPVSCRPATVWSIDLRPPTINVIYLMCVLKQLSSLRSGHRRLTGSPTRETQHSRNQHSQIGTSSISLRSSSTDKNESNRKTNKVNMIYLYVVTAYF